jgi:N-methylhydantoinase B
VQLRYCDIQYAEPGDVIWTKSGGGGGYGDPLNRTIEMVRWDALNEYISMKRAGDVYGVVLDPTTLQVDYEATEALRKKLKTEKRAAATG